jgi:hypothetical protein
MPKYGQLSKEGLKILHETLIQCKGNKNAQNNHIREATVL